MNNKFLNIELTVTMDIKPKIYIYVIINSQNVWLFVDCASLCHVPTQITDTSY